MQRIWPPIGAALAACWVAGCNRAAEPAERLPFTIVDVAPCAPGAGVDSALIADGHSLAQVTAKGDVARIPFSGREVRAIAAREGERWVFADGQVHHYSHGSWRVVQIPLPPATYSMSGEPGDPSVRLSAVSSRLLVVALRIRAEAPRGMALPPVATLVALIEADALSASSLLEGFDTVFAFRGTGGGVVLASREGELARFEGGRWVRTAATRGAVAIGEDGRFASAYSFGVISPASYADDPGCNRLASLQDSPRIVANGEPVLVEPLVAQLVVEALAVRVLDWFPRSDEVQLYVALIGPGVERLAGNSRPGTPPARARRPRRGELPIRTRVGRSCPRSPLQGSMSSASIHREAPDAQAPCGMELS